jgi:hypothetical protein
VKWFWQHVPEIWKQSQVRVLFEQVRKKLELHSSNRFARLVRHRSQAENFGQKVLRLLQKAAQLARWVDFSF